MQLPIFTVFLVLIVICSGKAQPYQYAYYLSLPGHYQSLEVNDGATVVNHPQQFAISRNHLQPNPPFRNGRNYPSFQPSTFERQNPTLNRRPEVPFYRGIPDGQLDPLYNTPQNYQPNELRPRNYDPYYGGQRRSEFPTSEGFTPYGKLTSDRNSQSDQEFGEEAKFPRSAPPSEDNNEEREEVTTEEPCSFCGVEKVNPKDGIDGTADPDSEPIEPKNVGVSPQPPFAIANNAVTPGFGIPYYVIL